MRYTDNCLHLSDEEMELIRNDNLRFASLCFHPRQSTAYIYILIFIALSLFFF